MSVDVYVTTTVQGENQGEARESGRRIASQNSINLLPPKMRVPVGYYIEVRASGSGEEGGSSLR